MLDYIREEAAWLIATAKTISPREWLAAVAVGASIYPVTALLLVAFG